MNNTNAINWYDKYQRDVEGLNNEGDPIGGDPPRGLRHLAEDGKAAISALRSLTESMEQHPDGYEGQCWCATCRSYMADSSGVAGFDVNS